MKSNKSLDPRIIPQIAEILKALGHPLRLRLLEILANGEFSVGKLQQRLGIPQAIASQQLRIMKNGGVVLAKRQGNQVLYSLANPGLLNLLHCLHSCQEFCLGKLPAHLLQSE